MSMGTHLRLTPALVLATLLCACPFRDGDNDTPGNGYRQAMRDFVQDLSAEGGQLAKSAGLRYTRHPKQKRVPKVIDESSEGADECLAASR